MEEIEGIGKAIADFDGANEDELTFKEGDEISVLRRDTGSDGWWEGFLSKEPGKIGYFPGSYVEFKSNPKGNGDAPLGGKMKRYRVMFDYEGRNDGDLAVKEGEVLEGCISEESPEWIEATLRGEKGFVPANYVEEIVEEESEKKKESEPTVTRIAGPKEIEMEKPRSAADIGIGKTFIIGTDGLWVSEKNDPITVEITLGEHKQKKFGGMKTFSVYKIRNSLTGNTVAHRYKHFDWFAHNLHLAFPLTVFPRLPDKQVSGRFEEEFLSSRARALTLFMNFCGAHPLIRNFQPFITFLEKDSDHADWKPSKRSTERICKQQHAQFISNVGIQNISDPTICQQKVTLFRKTMGDNLQWSDNLYVAYQAYENRMRALGSETERLCSPLNSLMGITCHVPHCEKCRHLSSVFQQTSEAFDMQKDFANSKEFYLCDVARFMSDLSVNFKPVFYAWDSADYSVQTQKPSLAEASDKFATITHAACAEIENVHSEMYKHINEGMLRVAHQEREHHARMLAKWDKLIQDIENAPK